ncbi:hypothetical protein KUCAC02_014052 [Chaenocephalus aceratus]|uniref:Uncharacterized protein n=1 Tax=Chaenocephalus aceratus TaxID=36190 RepID=A0ACB9WCV6_CHAAC|nr:hypothetical protein KUCAC02_014052 [Chaenocephalus aceratus]
MQTSLISKLTPQPKYASHNSRAPEGRQERDGWRERVTDGNGKRVKDRRFLEVKETALHRLLSPCSYSAASRPNQEVHKFSMCVLGNGAAGPLKAGGYLIVPYAFHSLLPMGEERERAEDLSLSANPQTVSLLVTPPNSLLRRHLDEVLVENGVTFSAHVFQHPTVTSWLLSLRRSVALQHNMCLSLHVAYMQAILLERWVWLTHRTVQRHMNKSKEEREKGPKRPHWRGRLSDCNGHYTPLLEGSVSEWDYEPFEQANSMMYSAYTLILWNAPPTGTLHPLWNAPPSGTLHPLETPPPLERSTLWNAPPSGTPHPLERSTLWNAPPSGTLHPLERPTHWNAPPSGTPTLWNAYPLERPTLWNAKR